MELNNQNTVQSNISNVDINNIPQPQPIPSQNLANGVANTYIPYTPENPTNVGVVTNTVQTMTSNIQNVVQQQENNMASAQVVQPTITAGLAQAMEQPVQQPVVNTVEPQQQVNVQPTQPVQQPQGQPLVKPVEKINTDKYIIRTSELKEMIKNACNLAVDIDGITLTTIIQLMFTKDGLIMKSTDNDNILIEKNSNITYNEEISIAVKSQLLQKLISKLNCEYIELIPDVQTRVITLIADDYTFKLSEIYDQEDGQSIDIDNPYYIQGTPGLVFDGSALKDKFNSVKSFTSTQNVFAFLTGVYCSDKIYATNRDDMIVTPNLPELANQTIYLTGKFVNAFIAMNWVGETHLYLQKDAQGNTTSITVFDDTKILSGPVNPDIDQFPIQALDTLTAQNLGNSFEIDAKKLYEIVDVSTLFVNSVQDKDVLDVECIPSDMTLRVRTKSGASDCKFNIKPIDPTQCVLPQQHFGLFTSGMLNALKNIDRTKVSMSIGKHDEQGKSIIMLYSGDFTVLLSMKKLD